MASSSSGKLVDGANGSGSSNTKKVIRVSLDTSDTINLNHLDVLPMQLVETLDRNIEEVNVKLRTPENKKPNNDSSDANNNPLNETYNYNRDRDRAPCGNVNLNLYSAFSDITQMTPKLQLLNNKTSFSSSSSRKKRNSDYNHNNCHYSTLSRENVTNARMTRKYKTKVNSSPSFDRFGRMNRITANFAEKRNSETSVSECQVRMDKKKRQPIRVNLADILPLSDSLSISDSGNQNGNGTWNRASEESWSAGVPETVQKDIVKKIMDLGLDLKSGIKSSHALRKLQEALQDLQNDWQSDFTRSSPTIPNSPNKNPDRDRNRDRNRRNEQEAEYISEDSQSGSADSSDCLSLEPPFTKTTHNKSNSHNNKENQQKNCNLSSDYKPPVAVAPVAALNQSQNQLQKSQQVLTLCPNRADLFTCHSSDCSVSDFLVTATTPRREPPLSPSPSSRIQEIQKIQQQLLLSLKPTADYQPQPQDQGQPGQRSLTPQSETPAEPKLSPEKVAAIWNWVSPKYDQVSQQDFELEVIRRKKEKLIKTAVAAAAAGEKQKHGKATPTAPPKKGSKTNNKHVNNSSNPGSKKIKLKRVNSSKKKIQSQTQRTTAVTIKKIKSKIMKLKPLLASINLIKTNNADVTFPLKSHHPTPTPTTATAANSHPKQQQLYVPSRPSTPSLTFEYRGRDEIFDGEYYEDIQNENDSINAINKNNPDHGHGHYDMYSPRDCHLFLSDPITQNVFSRVSFQDGSFSTADGDILPSRPFRGGPGHMDTGHLDSYVSQVLSSVNLQEQEDIVNANSNIYENHNHSIVDQYEIDEANEHEPGLEGARGTELTKLGPVFKNKDIDDHDHDEVHEIEEIEVDSVLERTVMTPPCTSNWNLSPLYEAIATTGNNFVNLHESILNLKSEVFDESFEDRVSSGDVGDDCRCEDCDCPQLHLAKAKEPLLKNDYNNNVHSNRRSYEELTIMEQLELLEDGNGSETGATLTEWNSECECCSMSMSPLVFSADLYGSMADVHSGDEIATRCSTSSSVTEFEHQGVECVSNTNVMTQVRKLSSIRNKLRLLDLLKETVTGTATGKAETDAEKMRTNSQDSKVDLLMTSNSLPVPLATRTDEGSARAEIQNQNDSENLATVDVNNVDTALTNRNLVQLQCPAPDCHPDYKKQLQKQKLRLPFPFELNPTTTVDEESMMKQFYFLPLPPTDPIKIELTFRKSFDSMKAQPPSPTASSPSVTARLDPPTPTAAATIITDVSHALRNRNENIPKKPKTRNSDQHQNQPAPPSKHNSAHVLQTTTILSGESLSKKSRKKKTRKKNHDDPTEETGTMNCETDTIKEKKHRKHRRHHEENDGGADLKCDEDPQQQSHKKRSSTKKDRSHIEKLKSILPRTPGGRYTLRGKEAEDAIADYVKAELATSLGIGFGFHGQGQRQGQGQEGHLDTIANLPISESKAKILEAGCFHDLVRSVTSSLVDNQDKKGKEMGPNGNNKIQQQQQQVLVNNNNKPKPRSKKHMENSISGISKSLPGSKSLKILNMSKNNVHSHSNPYMAHHQTYQRVIASTAAARKRMSVGVIPKQSTRPNFLRYQQQSIAAMINISKARASQHVKGYASTGSKNFVGSSTGSGSGAGAGLGRLTNNGIGSPIIDAGSGSGIGGSSSPYYNHNCSPARSNISNSTYQQYQRLPPHHPHSLSHVRLKTNRRNAVTVVFDSTTATGNTAGHRE